MTKIELLFREQGRSKPITFEEFNHAGWSKKEGVSRKKWAFRYSKIEKCGIMII